MMHRNVLLGFALALPLLQGCRSLVAPSAVHEQTSQIEYQLLPTHRATDAVQYRRSGGGDLEFTIAESASSFAVHVSRNSFRVVDINLEVTKSNVQSDVVSLLESIYRGTIDVGGTLVRDPRLLTGTWSYVYIHDGDGWLRVANATIISNLQPFESLVRARLDQMPPAPEPVPPSPSDPSTDGERPTLAKH